MTIISAQSHVSYGYVGNSAAVFALRRLGHEVCPVHTALLAHHPGYGSFNGALTPPETVSAILEGLQLIGVYTECSALLSGYLGSVKTGEAVLGAWREIQNAAPDAVYCCDPVIGDVAEGVYVDPALPDFFRERALPKATAAIVNVFEAGFLTGEEVTDVASAIHAADQICSLGPVMTIVTSVRVEERGGGQSVGNLYVDPDGIWLARSSRIDLKAKGPGDFLTALWLGRFVQTRDGIDALRFAVGGAQMVIENANVCGSVELPIVETAEAWLSHSQDVPIERLR